MRTWVGPHTRHRVRSPGSPEQLVPSPRFERLLIRVIVTRLMPADISFVCGRRSIGARLRATLLLWEGALDRWHGGEGLEGRG